MGCGGGVLSGWSALSRVVCGMVVQVSGLQVKVKSLTDAYSRQLILSSLPLCFAFKLSLAFPAPRL